MFGKLSFNIHHHLWNMLRVYSPKVSNIINDPSMLDGDIWCRGLLYIKLDGTESLKETKILIILQICNLTLNTHIHSIKSNVHTKK
jgi:hypothetical protein